jgi:hypothetical protein
MGGADEAVRGEKRGPESGGRKASAAIVGD